MTPPTFVWATHQVPVTRWFKAELRERAPALRFAFARPGLSTFKVDGPAPDADFGLPSSFARAYGLSLGRATSEEDVLTLGGGLPAGLRLHVFERDIDVPVDEQDPAVQGQRAAAVRAALLARAPGRFAAEPAASPGDLVLDVVVAHASQPDDGWLVGYHRHHDAHGPGPGGVLHVPLPDEAPSRAWCKIEEVLRWADLALAPRDRAIELGSAPGGASLALLSRGLEVFGIDPGPMDPRVLSFSGPCGNRFRHLRVPAAEVQKSQLPRRYEWLLCDVNLAPMVALRYVERFTALAHGGLKGAVLTLKLNDEGVFAALPGLRERIAKLGPRCVRYTQVPSHRSEIAAILRY